MVRLEERNQNYIGAIFGLLQIELIAYALYTVKKSLKIKKIYNKEGFLPSGFRNQE